VTAIKLRAIKVGTAVSATAGIVAVAISGGRALLLDVYLLCMGGVVLLALVRLTRARAAGTSSPFDRAVAAMRSRPADSEDSTLARELELATFSAFHLHTRVRPVLRDIAAHRLRARYGVELDREAARARELIGEQAWELVRPDRPPSADRLGRGPNLAQLARVVDELEAI
jgi:hypothetical protein